MNLARRYALFLAIFALSLVFSISAAASSITFKVTLPDNQPQPIMGRLFIIIARANDPEPRFCQRFTTIKMQPQIAGQKSLKHQSTDLDYQKCVRSNLKLENQIGLPGLQQQEHGKKPSSVETIY